MIDRLESLNTKMHSPHNRSAIIGCQRALAALEARTAERLARGVEGTPKP